MDANEIWTTGVMELGDYNVRFEITQETMSNFYEGEVIEVTAVLFDKDRKTFKRKLRYSRDQGVHFTWNGWAICYDDFKETLDNSVYNLD